MKRGLAYRIHLVLGLIGLVILTFSMTVMYIGLSVKDASQKVVNMEMPLALNSLAMLEELGDMNSNLTEYVLGEIEEKEEYASNFDEFQYFRSLLPEGVDDLEVNKVARLVEDHRSETRSRVFAVYDPTDEKSAGEKIKNLIRDVGRPLETLLDQMKEEEIADVGDSDIEDIINDDLPGVRYYLELVDEAGDMLASLDRFVLGDPNARREFFANALDFESYFVKLKPLEQKPDELVKINEIERLFMELKLGGTDIFETYSPESKNNALNAIDYLEHNHFREAELILDKLSDTSRAQVEQSMLSLGNVAAQSLWLVLAAFSVGVGLMIYVTIYVRRSILHPVLDISTSIQRLRQGERDFEIDLGGATNEFGSILISLQEFQYELAELDKLRASDKALHIGLSAEKEKVESALDHLKETQQHLIESEKLASLGAMVAGISHEINTPIGVGVTIATHLQDTTEGFLNEVNSGTLNKSSLIAFEENSQKSLSILVSSLKQASELISSFKQVSADQSSDQIRTFKLADMLDEVLLTLHYKVKNSAIKYTVEGDETIEMTSCPGALGQVVTNIFNNALLHAFDGRDKGEINIKFYRLDDTESVKLVISDDGKGIAEEHLAKIFDPFFTTKLGQGGSGLGMNIVYNIVTNVLNGTVAVMNNNGTTFEIILPLVSSNAENKNV